MQHLNTFSEPNVSPHCEHRRTWLTCVVQDARVGGHWEVAAPQTSLIKEGLVRLSCLLSFDIITLDLWTQIAPHWMVTIGGYTYLDM